MLPGAAATLPWLIRAPKERQEISICWKESRANSVSRREWTRQAAAILKSQYRPGSGIIISFGDLMGILREAGIPQRESLHEGNPAAWNAATSVPQYFLHEEWAVAISGDRVATAIVRSRRTGPRYRPVAVIAVKGAPVIEIYRRD